MTRANGMGFDNDTDSTVCIILILVFTGVRIGELFNVPKSAVNIQDGYMVGGEKTKAGRDRIIAFPDCILKYIEDLYNATPEGGKLIDGYDGDKAPDNFRKRQHYPTLERLGIRKLNPHEKSLKTCRDITNALLTLAFCENKEKPRSH